MTAEAKVELLRIAAKRVLEADMRGVRDLDALNALEDAAGFTQQGQRRSERSGDPAGNLANAYMEEHARAEALSVEVERLRVMLRNLTDPNPGGWTEALHDARRYLDA